MTAPRDRHGDAVVRISVLGRLAVEVCGREVDVPVSWRAQSLLGWLALHPGTHRRADLASRFWPDILDSSARASLRTSLWALRRSIAPAGADALVTNRDRIGIAAGPGVWVDATAFGELVAEGAFTEALELCRGEVLQGLDDEWVYDAREAHLHRLVDVLGSLAAQAEESGDLDAAVSWTRRQVDLDVLAEVPQRELMRRLAAAGDRGRAGSAYQRLCERLRTELGVTPSAATREVARSLRLDDPALEPQLATGHPPAGAVVAVPDPSGGWEPPSLFPPPVLLSAEHPGPFVGRASELEVVEQAWREACRSCHPVFLLLSGEAGIGKTRLAAEFARTAAAEGAMVLYGRADQEALVPHQPFVEALRHYVTVASPGELSRRLSWQGPHLARVAPELARRAPEVAAAAEESPESQRYLVFQAVASLLVELAATAPVLLVLDDLHWADKTTSALLGHVLSPDRRCRLLVIGTYREHDVVPGVPLAGSLAQLGPARSPTRLRLSGLAPEAVSELARRSGAEGLAEDVHARTEGNPFFVMEMLRHAEQSSGRTGLPETVREAIGHRLARLGEGAIPLLTVAAVIGREFDLRVLEQVSELSSGRLVDLVEESTRAGVLVELPEQFERFSFAHALIREKLVDDLTGSRRRRLHARVVAALEESHGDDLDEVMADLAHHSCAAGRAGDLDKAVSYAVRAAEQARVGGALAEAVELYTRALRLLPDDDSRRRGIAVRRAVAYQSLTHLLLDVQKGAAARDDPAQVVPAAPLTW